MPSADRIGFVPLCGRAGSESRVAAELQSARAGVQRSRDPMSIQRAVELRNHIRASDSVRIAGNGYCGRERRSARLGDIERECL